MANDYKRSAAYKPKTQIPGWLLFVSGLAIGAFGSFLYFIKQHDAPDRVVAESPPRVTQPEVADTATPPPRFDFYTILPEQEVVIPDPEPQKIEEIKPAKIKPETAKSAIAVVPQTAAPIVKKGNYVLQIGSFKKMEEADRLRASLALVGVESSIQIVNISDTDSWHRVRVGPFENIEQANQQRDKLKQKKFNSLLLRIKS